MNDFWILLTTSIGYVVLSGLGVRRDEKNRKEWLADNQRAAESKEHLELAVALATLKNVDLCTAQAVVERASEDQRNKWRSHGLVAAEIVLNRAAQRPKVPELVAGLAILKRMDIEVVGQVVRCSSEDTLDKWRKEIAAKPWIERAIAADIEEENNSILDRVLTLRAGGNDAIDINMS